MDTIRCASNRSSAIYCRRQMNRMDEVADLYLSNNRKNNIITVDIFCNCKREITIYRNRNQNYKIRNRNKNNIKRYHDGLYRENVLARSLVISLEWRIFKSVKEKAEEDHIPT